MTNNPRPLVSVLTPTYNRRIFIPQLLRNFRRQTFPIDKMEMIIIDDGSDPIADLVEGVPNVRYIHLEERKQLGYKRNMLAREARGEILIHMDDDDYYPPNRVSHAVKVLLNGSHLLAGSSELYIYDICTKRIYRSGPFGPTHATNRTLAYKKEYLENNRFDDDITIRDEALFTNNFTSPMIQLDAKSTGLCIKHEANTWNKANSTSSLTPYTLKDFIKDKEAIRFYSYQLKRKLGAQI